MHVRAFASGDLSWAESLIGAEFGGRLQARRGELLDVLDLPGFIAESDGEPVGVLTFRPDGDAHELAYIEAVTRLGGIGTALLAAFVSEIQPATTWLVTTNDNVDALRFYQRRGFVIREVRVDAVTVARNSLKPTIGLVGDHGIEIRDEIELVRAG